MLGCLPRSSMLAAFFGRYDHMEENERAIWNRMVLIAGCFVMLSM